MLPYSLTTMMCFLTKEWYGFPAYTVNLFIKAYNKITYKEDLKITQKRCVLDMICSSLWFWLWCAFYNRSLKKNIILLSKCTSRLANKRIHIKLASSAWRRVRKHYNSPSLTDMWMLFVPSFPRLCWLSAIISFQTCRNKNIVYVSWFWNRIKIKCKTVNMYEVLLWLY